MTLTGPLGILGPSTSETLWWGLAMARASRQIGVPVALSAPRGQTQPRIPGPIHAIKPSSLRRALSSISDHIQHETLLQVSQTLKVQGVLLSIAVAFRRPIAHTAHFPLMDNTLLSEKMKSDATRIEFTATQPCYSAEDALVAGVAAADGAEYLTFQRSPEGSPPGDDWGVHLEYADQSNGEYGAVAACQVSRGSLEVDLSKPLGALAHVGGLRVALDIPGDSFAAFVDGLRRVFRGGSTSWRSSGNNWVKLTAKAGVPWRHLTQNVVRREVT